MKIKFNLLSFIVLGFIVLGALFSCAKSKTSMRQQISSSVLDNLKVNHPGIPDGQVPDTPETNPKSPFKDCKVAFSCSSAQEVAQEKTGHCKVGEYKEGGGCKACGVLSCSLYERAKPCDGKSTSDTGFCKNVGWGECKAFHAGTLYNGLACLACPAGGTCVKAVLTSCNEGLYKSANICAKCTDIACSSHQKEKKCSGGAKSNTCESKDMGLVTDLKNSSCKSTLKVIWNGSSCQPCPDGATCREGEVKACSSGHYISANKISCEACSHTDSNPCSRTQTPSSCDGTKTSDNTCEPRTSVDCKASEVFWNTHKSPVCEECPTGSNKGAATCSSGNLSFNCGLGNYLANLESASSPSCKVCTGDVSGCNEITHIKLSCNGRSFVQEQTCTEKTQEACKVSQVFWDGTCKICDASENCQASAEGKITQCQSGYYISSNGQACTKCTDSLTDLSGFPSKQFDSTCENGTTTQNVQIVDVDSQVDCKENGDFWGESTFFSDSKCQSCPAGATCGDTSIITCHQDRYIASGSTCSECTSSKAADVCSDETQINRSCGGDETSDTSFACRNKTASECKSPSVFYYENTCKLCPTGATCSLGTITSCPVASPFLDGDQCIASCVSKLDPNSLEGISCLDCPANATCQAGKLTACSSGKKISADSRSCTDSCPTTDLETTLQCIFCPHGATCSDHKITQCPSLDPYLSYNKEQCFKDNCQSDLAPTNDATKQCQECSIGSLCELGIIVAWTSSQATAFTNHQEVQKFRGYKRLYQNPDFKYGAAAITIPGDVGFVAVVGNESDCYQGSAAHLWDDTNPSLDPAVPITITCNDYDNAENTVYANKSTCTAADKVWNSKNSKCMDKWCPGSDGYSKVLKEGLIQFTLKNETSLVDFLVAVEAVALESKHCLLGLDFLSAFQAKVNSLTSTDTNTINFISNPDYTGGKTVFDALLSGSTAQDKVRLALLDTGVKEEVFSSGGGV